MGFEEEMIERAVQVCSSREQAVNYIMGSNQVDKMQEKQNSEDYEQVEEDYKMIFVVRMDLKLSINSMAQLVAAGALTAYRKIEKQVDRD